MENVINGEGPKGPFFFARSIPPPMVALPQEGSILPLGVALPPGRLPSSPEMALLRPGTEPSDPPHPPLFPLLRPPSSSLNGSFRRGVGLLERRNWYNFIYMTILLFYFNGRGSAK